MKKLLITENKSREFFNIYKGIFQVLASENPNNIIFFFISVKWTFNGDEIGDTETLTIKEITEDNVGTYACNVSNRAGNLQN